MRNNFVWTYERHKQKNKSNKDKTQDHKVKSLVLYQLS
jgi:hypothetical protein